MNRIIQGAMAVTALAASGCLMTRGGDLPDLAHPPIAQAAPPMTLSYQFHWLSSGQPNAAAGAVMGEPLVGPELTQSGAFKQVFVGHGGQNQLDITVNNHGNKAVALITGIISGLTLTVLPGYARDNYDMTAVLSRNGAEVKRYEYSEHVTLVMELLLVFGMPFVEGKDAPKNAIRDMTRHLVQDMRSDGSLNG